MKVFNKVKNTSVIPNWPILKTYENDSLDRIEMPIGGIGTGTVSLAGNGGLRSWEIMNRPAKGYNPRAFFALFAKPIGQKSSTILLEGPLPKRLYEGPFGSTAILPGLPRFSNAKFSAAYPLAQVYLSDKSVPVDILLQAFNPLIPADCDNSSLPIAVLKYTIHNPTNQKIDLSICGSLCNFIGNDGVVSFAKSNRNRFKKSENISGILMDSLGVDKTVGTWGTMALSAIGCKNISYRTNWTDPGWSTDIIDFWDDFSSDGVLDERPILPNINMPVGSICASIKLQPKSCETLTFVLSWHFPNRWSWIQNKKAKNHVFQEHPGNQWYATVGNYYTTLYSDAWDVIEKASPHLEQLENDTVEFVNTVVKSSVPNIIKEAALFNLPALRSQTSFRLPSGEFMGWEGCGDTCGSCWGSCSHVWNYDLATPYLFSELSSSMRKVEFLDAIRKSDGKMSFRVRLPLIEGNKEKLAAADGQMGCLVKLYRDWQLSGEDNLLKQLWTNARKAMEFCWVDGGWDADQDGVMEGCQHNTMDVEYYGPNPQMQGWYLAALKACYEMALYNDDIEFANKCKKILESGSKFTDKRLFNGAYYEQLIWKPTKNDVIHPDTQSRKLRKDELLKDNEIDSQLGNGCLIDQLIGVLVAKIIGIDDLLNTSNIKQTLQSIYKNNYIKSQVDNFNPMRAFAVADESSFIMGSYPKDKRPIKPFPYYAESMTGFEYTLAVHLLSLGYVDRSLKVFNSIRSRYDGVKRNPFDEAECGHHYARAMMSWGGLLAATGFCYSAVKKVLVFNKPNKDSDWFWSTGKAYGNINVKLKPEAIQVEISVKKGCLEIQKIEIKNYGSKLLKTIIKLTCKNSLKVILKNDIKA